MDSISESGICIDTVLTLLLFLADMHFNGCSQALSGTERRSGESSSTSFSVLEYDVGIDSERISRACIYPSFFTLLVSRAKVPR